MVLELNIKLPKESFGTIEGYGPGHEAKLGRSYYNGKQ